jgi:hypothetical protein
LFEDDVFAFHLATLPEAPEAVIPVCRPGDSGQESSG